MPIIQSFATAAARAYGLMASGLRKVTDTFTRSNNASSLGTSDSGHPWENVRGTWGISSNQASTSTSASTYPIAAVQYGSVDATIIADISQGSGLAFWINDSSNWWGVASSTSTSQYCSSSQANSACSAGYSYCASTGYFCQSWVSQCNGGSDVCTQNTYACTGYGVVYITAGLYSYACTSYGVSGCAAWQFVCSSGYSTVCGVVGVQCTSTAFVCTATAVYSYTCVGYANSYSYKVDLLKSVANTITTVATTALSSLASSLKLVLSNSGISMKAYSGSSASGSEVGSITNSASGASKYTKHGIILTSSNPQETTVDNLTIDIVQ